MKKVSEAQEKARWKNFAKMRVAGAVSLTVLLGHKLSYTIPSKARFELEYAITHLNLALKEWEEDK